MNGFWKLNLPQDFCFPIMPLLGTILAEEREDKLNHDNYDDYPSVTAKITYNNMLR